MQITHEFQAVLEYDREFRLTERCYSGSGTAKSTGKTI